MGQQVFLRKQEFLDGSCLSCFDTLPFKTKYSLYLPSKTAAEHCMIVLVRINIIADTFLLFLNSNSDLDR